MPSEKVVVYGLHSITLSTKRKGNLYKKKKSYEHKPNSIAYNWTSVTVVTNRELQNQFEISQNQEVKVKSCKPQHRLWYSPVRQNSTNLVYVHN